MDDFGDKIPGSRVVILSLLIRPSRDQDTEALVPFLGYDLAVI